MSDIEKEYTEISQVIKDLDGLLEKRLTPGYMSQLGRIHQPSFKCEIAYQAYGGANNYHSPRKESQSFIDEASEKFAWQILEYARQLAAEKRVGIAVK